MFEINYTQLIQYEILEKLVTYIQLTFTIQINHFKFTLLWFKYFTDLIKTMRERKGKNYGSTKIWNEDRQTARPAWISPYLSFFILRLYF